MRSPRTDDRPVLIGGQLVAVTGPAGCAIVAGLDPAMHRLAAAMCLFYDEIASGRAPGPYTSRRAERWARALLLSLDQQETVTWNGASAGDPSAA
jgi:hypothetical protein